MSTLTVMIEQCRYTLELRTIPWMFAGAPVALCAAPLALWRSTSLVKAVAIPLSIVGSLAAFHWAYGWVNALSGATRGAAVAHSSSAFLALGALSATVVIAAVCGALRMGSALFGASAARSRSALSALPALALAMMGGALVAHGRAAIGRPNTPLPHLLLLSELRGQVGVAQQVRVELAWPSSRGLFGNLQTWRLTPAQLATHDAASARLCPAKAPRSRCDFVENTVHLRSIARPRSSPKTPTATLGCRCVSALDGAFAIATTEPPAKEAGRRRSSRGRRTSRRATFSCTDRASCAGSFASSAATSRTGCACGTSSSTTTAALAR